MQTSIGDYIYEIVGSNFTLTHITEHRAKKYIIQLDDMVNITYVASGTMGEIQISYINKKKVIRNNQNRLKLKYIYSDFKKKDIKKVSEMILKFTDHFKKYQNRPSRILIIINPIGGKGDSEKKFHKKIKPLLTLMDIKFKLEITTAICNINEIICAHKKYMGLKDNQQIQGIMAIGGDGHINKIYNCLVANQIDIPIIPVPLGSQNSIIMGTSNNFNLKYHILKLIYWTSNMISMDIMKCEYDDHENLENKTTYGFVMAGFGFLGDAIYESKKYRWMGPTRYTFCGIKTLLSGLKTYKLKLTTDARDQQDKELFLMACFNLNGSGTQNSKMVNAKYNDGNLYLMSIDQCSRFRIIKFLIYQKFNKHITLPYVHIECTKNIVCEFDELQYVNLDGECLQLSEIKIELINKKAKLLI